MEGIICDAIYLYPVLGKKMWILYLFFCFNLRKKQKLEEIKQGIIDDSIKLK